MSQSYLLPFSLRRRTATRKKQQQAHEIRRKDSCLRRRGENASHTTGKTLLPCNKLSVTNHILKILCTIKYIFQQSSVYQLHSCLLEAVLSKFQVCINTSLQLQFQSSLSRHSWLQKSSLDFQGLSNGILGYVSSLSPQKTSLTTKMDSLLSA